MFPKRKLIFWLAIVISIIVGLYGLLTNRMVIFIPYAVINPILFAAITSLKIFENIRGKLERLGAVIIFINIPGSLYLHDLGIQYDVPLHFAVGFIIFSALNYMMPLLLNNQSWNPVANVFLVIIAGLIFEGIQKSSDTLFGTKLFFDASQPIGLDFAIDITMNTLGALTAAILKTKQAS